MFNRQFSLLVIATLLLSPNLVHANEIDGDSNLSVGNIQILNTGNGTILKTPNIQINSPKATENQVLVSRNRRRSRATVIRSTRTSKPLIFNQKVNSSTQTTVTTTTPSTPSSTTRSSTTTTSTPSTPSSTTRSSTIRNSSSGNGSQSVNEQQQSIQCSGGGSSVSQSTSTVNGRTVSSESRTNCD